jgi:hypothetical protein
LFCFVLFRFCFVVFVVVLELALGGSDGGVLHLDGGRRLGAGRWVRPFPTIAQPGVAKQRPVPEVQGNVGGDAADEPIGDGVCQGHEDDGDERGDGLLEVLPVDLHHGFHHHDADDDECRADRPGGNGSQQRSEEQGEEEVEGDSDGREARAPALPDARRRLDERRHGGRPEQRPGDDRRRVAHEGEVLAREVALGVHEAGKLGHGEQRACRVQDVDVQERDERHPQLARAKLTETQHPRRLLDLVDVHHLLEVLVRRVPGGRVREVGHLQDGEGKHIQNQ